jgi:predicted DNA-binding ribbon-helix-helix protein
MTTISLRLPDSTHHRLKAWAKQDKLSINQLITTAVAEKMAALATIDAIEKRAQSASLAKFTAALSRVPTSSVALEDRWD